MQTPDQDAEDAELDDLLAGIDLDDDPETVPTSTSHMRPDPDLGTETTDDLAELGLQTDPVANADTPTPPDPELTQSEPVPATPDSVQPTLGDDEAGQDDSNDVDDFPAQSGEVTDDLDDLLAGLNAPSQDQTPSDDDLDSLLDDLGDLANEVTEEPDTPASSESTTANEMDDLDALLADLESDEDDPLTQVTDTQENDAVTGQDARLDSADQDLGELLGAGEASNEEQAADNNSQLTQSPFGRISASRINAADLNRSRFRIAVFGDFTGRASRGVRETGAALASREPILLDVDTVEDVIQGFATTLTLPIGKDGAGVSVPLKELDDLHPDELYENVALFEEISSLRQQLGTGSMAEKTKERLQAWGAAHGRPIHLPKRSASTSIPANLKLSDFQKLIGDTQGQLQEGGPIDDLIARIVGPHIVKAPDSGTDAMLAAVDKALSDSMRLVLHHPDFQAIESQWRSLDLLARRVETDASLEIVLYDVSAEELAMDLAAQEDLAESGLFDLLTSVTDPETGAGGFSALFGLYTFEETPPHAELLARIGQVARHVDAPFFSAITPAFLDIAKEDRHPLVAKAWDRLRATPEAAYLGLASPRVLLRLPYGKKSDPCYAFDFEEFSEKEGLSGMLWANPVILVNILLAATYKKDGKAMEPGSIMLVGDMPFHYVLDRHGDQIALPCTERNLTADPVQQTLARGIMPVVSIKGRNEVRLASFRSLSGAPIAGRWAEPEPETTTKVGADITLDIVADPQDADPDTQDAGTGDAELDALLAGFDDLGTAADADDDAMDPELASLLEGL